MSAAPATVEAVELSKTLGGQKVLSQVSFTLLAGQVTCLLGPNGSGKTTLLKILSTLILPDGGTARVLDCDLIREPALIRSVLGVHSGEDRSFYGRLSARENLLFFGALYGLFGPRLSGRLEEVSRTLGMGHFLDKRYQELSTGMKERVLLARAMLHDPPILLLDEPTHGLDPVAAERLLMDTVVPLARRERKTILMATHQLAEAEKVADQVIVLSRGQVAFVESRSGVRARLTEGRLLELMKSLDSRSEPA